VNARLASVLVLVFSLGLAAVPFVAFAQSDAGVDAVEAVDPAPAPTPEPSAAPAPEPEPDPDPEAAPEPKADDSSPAAGTALQRLSDELMAILVPAFGALVTGLVGLLLTWVRKKYKIDVGDKQLDAWSKLAGKAAQRGGEWARNKMRDMTDDKKIPGPEILEVAANWALDIGKASGLPDIGREKLEGLIEAHLFSRRLDVDDSLPLNP